MDSDTTASTAHVSWTVLDDLGQINGYEIKVQKKNCVASECEDIKIGLLSTPYEISNLDSAASYEVSIRIDDKVFGKSFWSDPLTINTKPSQLSGK